ncbi:hypothetical protein Tco_0066749 [Tanacetum coccineum]
MPTKEPYQAPAPQVKGVSKTDFENYVKANELVLRNIQKLGQVMERRPEVTKEHDAVLFNEAEAKRPKYSKCCAAAVVVALIPATLPVGDVKWLSRGIDLRLASDLLSSKCVVIGSYSNEGVIDGIVVEVTHIEGFVGLDGVRRGGGFIGGDQSRTVGGDGDGRMLLRGELVAWSCRWARREDRGIWEMGEVVELSEEWWSGEYILGKGLSSCFLCDGCGWSGLIDRI